MLETLGGGGTDNLSDGRRTRQRDSADRGMLGKRRADFGAEAGHDVDDAFRDAGSSFQDGIAIGKFQGVIMPQTPIGCRTAIANLLGSSEGTVGPNMRRPSPAL